MCYAERSQFYCQEPAADPSLLCQLGLRWVGIAWPRVATWRDQLAKPEERPCLLCFTDNRPSSTLVMSYLGMDGHRRASTAPTSSCWTAVLCTSVMARDDFGRRAESQPASQPCGYNTASPRHAPPVRLVGNKQVVLIGLRDIPLSRQAPAMFPEARWFEPSRNNTPPQKKKIPQN